MRSLGDKPSPWTHMFALKDRLMILPDLTLSAVFSINCFISVTLAVSTPLAVNSFRNFSLCIVSKVFDMSNPIKTFPRPLVFAAAIRYLWSSTTSPVNLPGLCRIVSLIGCFLGLGSFSVMLSKKANFGTMTAFLRFCNFLVLSDLCPVCISALSKLLSVRCFYF